jgi:hypothetical protein
MLLMWPVQAAVSGVFKPFNSSAMNALVSPTCHTMFRPQCCCSLRLSYATSARETVRLPREFWRSEVQVPPSALSDETLNRSMSCKG